MSDICEAEQAKAQRSCAEDESSSETELITAAQKGVSIALGELLNRHRSMLYRTVCHFNGNAQEAEDIVQETMLRAVRGIGTFRQEARFSSWLIAIAIHTAISIKRKERNVRWVFLDEPESTGDESPRAAKLRGNYPDPEQTFLDGELRTIVRRAISGQHQKFGFILRACDLDECSIDEAARALSITRAAAKSRLFRARRQLSNSVRKRTGIGVSR